MVLVAIALTVSVASATDWQQFQKDEISTGWTTDCAPIYDPPTLAWSYDVAGTGHAGVEGTPIVGDGKVFVLNYKGELFIFDAKTGQCINSTLCNAEAGTGFELSVPAYHDGIVYVATSKGNWSEGHGRVTAIYAEDGAGHSAGDIREQVDLGAGMDYFQLNTPVRYADGMIYVGNWKGGPHHTEDNGTYYCLDADDVTNEIWNRTAPYSTGYYWAGAAIVGDYIIFGDDMANVTCLNKSTGAFVDYINVAGQCGVTTVEEIRSSIVWNEDTGRIYFTGKKASTPRSGHAYAVSFNSVTGDLGGDNAVGGGTCEWNNSIDYSTSTPVVYNGRVYVCIGGVYGGEPAVLRCLDESNGNILYNYSLGGDVSQSSPAVSVWNGHVYIYFTTNVNNGSAYCVEDNGTGFDLQWVWNPPEPDNQYILQGMAISKGMVYFGTDEGYVYALAGICGDVDHNGLVNPLDAMKVYTGDVCSEWAADVDCNHVVNPLDAMKIYTGDLNCCGLA
jgi:outer membrane protein assembly factor BamB